jgi:hypothetical protein
MGAKMKNEEGNRMRTEELTMNNEKAKTCLDCLHCKVSAQSTFECQLCFCSHTPKKSLHKDDYWRKKSICQRFFDMTENPMRVRIDKTTTTALSKRKPLLKNKWYDQLMKGAI